MGNFNDYIVLKLGKPGKISKIDVDTSHFNGNQPSKKSFKQNGVKPIILSGHTDGGVARLRHSIAKKI